ncbi:unnamed protein product [Adineta ricciae]|uniref:Uncharacterized protein n=1 Tax=Adineta ricciae TaxID=249248 RepID=A0A813ZX12_ADIRI|nr:unnamed protein product [Adineta ricciae]CAF1335200.1 unnamed protein product [Adineta ricciae]
MMIVNINRTYSHLPDIVNDCEQRQVPQSSSNDQTKLICKQIAQSLRVVADQMDEKYCQDGDFNRNLHYLSIRLLCQSIFCTVWTRTLLPYIVLFCKTKSFLY